MIKGRGRSCELPWRCREANARCTTLHKTKQTRFVSTTPHLHPAHPAHPTRSCPSLLHADSFHGAGLERAHHVVVPPSAPALRRPRSEDSLLHPLGQGSPLASHHQGSGLRTLTKRSSGTELRKPIAARAQGYGWQEPTLIQLMAAEERRERRSSTSLSADTEWSSNGEMISGTGGESGLQGLWHEEPESAVLYPPLYGRPGPSPSPDLFSQVACSVLMPRGRTDAVVWSNRALLQPLLVSLSRPSSRPASPSHTPPGSPRLGAQVSAQLQRATARSLVPSPVADLRASSSLPAHFPPRTSNDPGPTVESQGFVLYVGSLVAWAGFLGWSLCPDPWLEAMGIAWYPSR